MGHNVPPLKSAEEPRALSFARTKRPIHGPRNLGARFRRPADLSTARDDEKARNPMRQALLAIVDQSIDEVNRTRKEKIPKDDVTELRLYGSNGVFDSMQLVNFLVLIEQRIDDDIGREISLTSERAVSRRISPFSSVRHLLDFIEEELGETKSAASA
jgi:hypothetical protein